MTSAHNATERVNLESTTSSEIRFEDVEKADKSACAFDDRYIKEKCNAKNDKRKEKKEARDIGVEEVHEIDRRALKSQRIEFAVAALLLFIASILIGLLFALWPRKTP